jgi:hypothetical protein
MKRWMKRNTIIFTINWWAKLSSPAFLLIPLTILTFSCRKEGDINLGSKTPNQNAGVLFTDTFTVINQTILLNDSIISAEPNYLSFGQYSDSYTGNLYAEAYCALSLFEQNIDYSGVDIDSANLYITYVDQYGDSTSGQDIGIHEITTELDPYVPYQVTTNFVSYDPTLVGQITNFKPAGHMVSMDHNTVRIPLTNTFANRLLSQADDKSNIDFNSNFYGIVIKPVSNTTANAGVGGGAVISATYSDSYYVEDSANTKIIVFFKRGFVPDSAVFNLYRSPSFNKVISDRSATSIASLQTNRSFISDAATNNVCFVQSGTGIVTKVQIPTLTKFNAVGDSSIIINKAILYVHLDEGSNLNTFTPITQLELLQLNPDNTYKYAITGRAAYIQGSGFNQLGTGYPTFDTITSTVKKYYAFEITSYAQSLIYNKLENDGFIITPVFNAFSANRVVVKSANAPINPMRLEIYYTKVK